MADSLMKSGKNGYSVVSTDTGKKHSSKPLTKATATKQLKALYSNVKDEAGAGFVANLFGGVRKDLSRSDKAFYNKVKNTPIYSIMVVRKPLASVFGKFLNLVSLGKFNASMSNQPYDKLFHLYVLMTYLDGGNVRFVLTERNETVRFQSGSSSDFTDKPDDVKQVPYTANSLTFGQLFDNTIKDDPSIWVYNFENSNCQDFLITLLKRNNLLTPELQTFVKQDTKELVNKALNPVVKAGLTAVTDIAAIGRKITGMGLNDNPCIHHNELGY